ncbi:MAG TPA: adenylate/guanylate cyclase domain-containing protein [Ramlibacter sp.]|uniref:MerR family transcriptional regulator n=1 Tax=Ramlibacter sp. TaxID=1917967 RepID=UPI002D810752|nr:adenylate/guanylate cyclase domain-containing protein [Ramlibacter sp.]HET8744621.1 adenylate/guanylate cyclase domain-containing protein [Ramlibacter sp.]
MLTSKEIIERTGISRATLNNYIASGLIAKPRVLPPGPEHGAAPRIGFFPDDTLARIETIQRLKREGWSITRIAGHFAAASHAGTAAPTPAASRPSQAAETTRLEAPPAPAPLASVPPPAPAAARNLIAAVTPVDAGQPAYLVNDAFLLVWMNEPAAASPLSPLAHRGASGNVLRHLLAGDEAQGRDALVRFHLEAARARGLPATQVLAGLDGAASNHFHALYGQIPRPAALPLVAQSLLPPAGAMPARRIHAVHFREGVLFALGEAGADAAAGNNEDATPPTLTPVAVLVAVLQDAADLWVRLSAEEYFELLNEVGLELDAIFRAHQGRPGRPVGEALACYFLPQPGGSYLWSALAAAHRARETMRQVSQRWRVRKGWDLELRVNIGIDEGQDWLGTLGLPGQSDLRVLGDAADRAGHLSRCSRMGAILLTRNLVGKLSREERQQLTYGVPRLEGTHGEAPLLFTFARLADLAGPGAAPAAVAELAVAELLALHAPAALPPGGSR